MAAKIRRNDEVIVISGSSKGKTGKVLSVLTKENKVLVEGLNLKTKHVKPNPQLGIEGGKQAKEAPIHVSNVAILNPTTNKADKVGFRFEDGKKVRFFKSNNEIIPNKA
ncbi:MULTISPECIES: 50S ribosomal protein L24 [unclassified Anaerobiospirillum]|uniref:50S ribosomal protein L24 n=1 Tax=unclassified Anaerobiospirillum TaxID=2647410 RepID=UPI001FF27A2B|nr:MULTISPECIES: 50S ribosomal protein L24 [unclassified Anaerobiospirillum]MCK0527083.1 50S ribosomal protein L24 [Anaerobiospirillum sp. NML120449]MCK0533873.1 50S ribosomal protein L24 [Anaerobiospirillum sp. NML120511]MCK0538937.1 50S ribosomal protein L24 [Anaerobiospirillum sp. NML02-A-032]